MADKLIVEVEDASAGSVGNPLHENPMNVIPGGAFIVGNRVVNSEGEQIGTVKRVAPKTTEPQTDLVVEVVGDQKATTKEPAPQVPPGQSVSTVTAPAKEATKDAVAAGSTTPESSGSTK